MAETTLKVIEATTGATNLGAIDAMQGATAVKIGKQTIVKQDNTEVNFASETTLQATNTSLGTDGGTTPPNGTGARGWLRGILDKLTSGINVNNFPTSFNVGNFPSTQVVSGSISVSNFPTTTDTTPNYIAQRSSNLMVVSTGAAAAAVTLTIPAVAGQFHYITNIEIIAYSTAARTGSATPVTVTSTNLNGFTEILQTAAAIGTIERLMPVQNSILKSTTVNTNTTIVCPATTSVIWSVKVYYYTSA